MAPNLKLLLATVTETNLILRILCTWRKLIGFTKMAELGLNQHHENVLISYIKFAKYMRSQNLKQIQQSFQDIDDRLFDSTYTKEEVKELIEDLEKIVMCDVESELINFAHNNVLMLKQLFKQAERWYLRLEIDMSELQNQEELEIVKLLESGESQFKQRPKAEGGEVVEEGSVSLLKMEIERLKEENARLSNIIKDVEDMAELYKEEKNKLGEKLSNAQKEMVKYKELAESVSVPRDDSETIKQMEAKLNEVQNLLSVNMENLEENENIKGRLKSELMRTQEKFKEAEAQLQLAEAELEKKFSETKAYANMKQILMRKNEKMKKLRDKLSKYEGEMEEEEEEEEEKEKQQQQKEERDQD